MSNELVPNPFYGRVLPAFMDELQYRFLKMRLEKSMAITQEDSNFYMRLFEELPPTGEAIR